MTPAFAPEIRRVVGGFPNVFGARISDGPVEGERRLWRAVLEQALRDALMIDGNPTGDPYQSLTFYVVTRATLPPTRDKALFWLLYDRHDYAEVCDMAAVDGRRLREWLRGFLVKHGVIQTAT